MSPAKEKKEKDLELELIKDLLNQKKRYEKYFESKPEKIENQAMSAYTGMVKTAVELLRKMKAESKGRLTPDELKEITRDILETDYGVGIDG